MRYCLLARSEPEAPALPDRDPLVVTLTDGSIRNGYTIKLLNKTAQPLVVTVGVEALPVYRLALIGADREGGLEVTLKPDAVTSLRAYRTLAPAAWTGGARAFDFGLTYADGLLRATAAARREGPR